MPLSTVESLGYGPEKLALRTKVSLAAFRIAWECHQNSPEGPYESLAEECADDADRCHDLREMHREQAALRQIGPRYASCRLDRDPRLPAGV